MLVSRTPRALMVLSLVAVGYAGCAPTPPPKTASPRGEQCIYGASEPAKWTFIDDTCGCPKGNALCAYEASVMRCLSDADETATYGCAKLPPVAKGKSDMGRIWKRLDLAALKLPAGTVKKIHACIEVENRKPENNSCPVATAQPIFPHFLSSCTAELLAQETSAPHPPNASPERARPVILALDNCDGDDCCLSPNANP
ncbi:hypothetical protein LVJ94_48085 [Pendulispora rubella]|uniref:Uncharacterized protein n=1 Tax=Pendulispora rubella TaxID=2741070 RepID=A0ABZ2L142_9BACT